MWLLNTLDEAIKLSNQEIVRAECGKIMALHIKPSFSYKKPLA